MQGIAFVSSRLAAFASYDFETKRSFRIFRYKEAKVGTAFAGLLVELAASKPTHLTPCRSTAMSRPAAVILIVQNPTTGEALDAITAQARSRATNNQFSTGSEGYYAGGKLEIDGERYQVTCSIVRIGSKPGSVPIEKRQEVGSAPAPAGSKAEGR